MESGHPAQSRDSPQPADYARSGAERGGLDGAEHIGMIERVTAAAEIAHL